MKYFFLSLTSLFLIQHMNSQTTANYDESQVPVFELSNPLITFDGLPINDKNEWEEIRRKEIFNFFETKVFGKVPGSIDKVSFDILEEKKTCFNGKAFRKQIEVKLQKDNREISFVVLLYLPKVQGRVPIFLGLNFHGNHTVNDDPNIIISKAWSQNNESLGIKNNTLDASSRGGRSNRWDIHEILEAGMGLATIYYGEIDPDKNDLSDGIQALFYKENQQTPMANEWGSISAWAYGLTKAMDYLVNDPDVDASRVIVFGHSRLGKAALWAGATDPRFVAVISNDSGCGGAALSKRQFGETIVAINQSFPYWFSENYKQFNNAESKLPIDQHGLLALIAPRPLYVASAAEDEWADPKGEFLSTYYAGPVYELYKKKGVTEAVMPSLNQPIHNWLGYHIRSGKHDVTEYDWEQYIKWSKKVLY